MHLEIQTVLVVVSVFAIARSNAFITSNWTSYKVEVIRREVDTSIIASSHNIKYVSQCAYKCSRNSSTCTSLYFIARTGECFCNHDFDLNTTDDPGTPEIIYGFKKMPADCLELYEEGYTEDGVYPIRPPGQTAVDAWCDMRDGGWTVVQRRQDGSENFYRKWTDYVTGFGNKKGEYWLGLDIIHALTSKESEGAINFEAFEDVNPRSANLTFAYFGVGGPPGYTLSFKGYISTCNTEGNFAAIANGMKFTTQDRDNDHAEQNCAVRFKGAWWYNACYRANINGQYLKGVHYFPCWGYNYSVRKTVLKVRRI